MTSQDDLALLKQMHERGELSDEQYDTLRRHVLWGTPLPQLPEEPPPAEPPPTAWPPRPRMAEPGASHRASAQRGPAEPRPGVPRSDGASVAGRGPGGGHRSGERSAPPSSGWPTSRPAPASGWATPPPAPRRGPTGHPSGPQPAVDRQPTIDRQPAVDDPTQELRLLARWESSGGPSGDTADPAGTTADGGRAGRRRNAGKEATADRTAVDKPARKPNTKAGRRTDPKAGRGVDLKSDRKGSSKRDRKTDRAPAGRSPVASVTGEPPGPNSASAAPALPTAPVPRRRRRRQRTAVAVTSAVLALILVAAGVWWFTLRSTGVKPAAYAHSVCADVRDWRQAISNRGSAMAATLAKHSDMPSTRAAVASYYSDVADRTNQLRVDVDAAGRPLPHPAAEPAGRGRHRGGQRHPCVGPPGHWRPEPAACRLRRGPGLRPVHRLTAARAA